MAIHEDDYVRKDGVYGVEREVRLRRAVAVRELQAAELGVRRWLLWIAVQVLITLATVVWLVVDPRWLTAVSLAIWVFAVGFAVLVNLPLKRKTVVLRRRGLELTQAEYEVAFARMLEAERS